jgi:hypothetical protein
MSYSGRYRPTNPGKYKGDPSKIIYRSLWERQVFKFLDENDDVVKWASEEVIIPYICKTDGKPHRYFVDLMIQLKAGDVYLVEIKPKNQTVPPKKSSRKTKRYVTEVLTYIKNESKWEAAKEYCKDRGYSFQVWTEDTIKGLGIKLLT